MSAIKRIFSTLFWLVLIGSILLIAWERGALRMPLAMLDPSGETAFEAWLAQDEKKAAEFRELTDYLQAKGVAGVIPEWQLARVDAFYAQKCSTEIWRLPPRDLWPNVVPALKLVREHVEPAMGAVEVHSSYRTPELNRCAGGASRSRHLRFEALDLRLADPRSDLSALYRDLCAMHDNAGPQSAMGLGAYYDFDDDSFNRGGRFHIDAAGYRSWGRSYTSASSPCGRFDEQ